MKRIEINQGKHALVDDADYERLSRYKWYLVGSGYVGRNLKKGDPSPHRRMHRMILDVAPDESVDHINGDKLDNRKCNLRLSTTSQNLANRPGLKGRKYKGVHLNHGAYMATISYNNTAHYLGRFKTPEEAATAYNEAAKKIHGEFACLNEI
jgi:HNH endonuclease/AP2 domain